MDDEIISFNQLDYVDIRRYSNRLNSTTISINETKHLKINSLINKNRCCIICFESCLLFILIMIIAILIVCLTTPEKNTQCYEYFQTIINENLLKKDSYPHSLALGDLNHDNLTDIVVVNSGSNSIDIFLNYGNGSFTSPIINTTGNDSKPMSIILADFNNDTHLDIAIANYDTHNIGIFLGYGNGAFKEQIFFSTNTSQPLALAVGYFNNDSWSDIVIANNGTHSISIIFGYGNGSFGNQITYSTGYDSFPYSVSVADLNHDSYEDIIVANYGTDNIGLFFGYGNGSFHKQIIYSTNSGSHPYSIAINDYNNDRKLDIAVVNSGTNSVGIFLGYGNGTFMSQMSYSISPGSNPRSIIIGDFNQDNKMDIAVSNYMTDDVSILIGFGNGSFEKPTIHSTGTDSGPLAMAIGDIDNNHQIDLVIVNFDTNNVLILLGYTMMQSAYPTNYSTGIGSQPYKIISADLNNDTELDLVTANFGTSNVGILFGYGNGSFQQQITYSSGTNSHPYGLAVADLDNDYQLDIVIGNSNTETLGILYGYGNGSFATLVTYSTGISSSIRDIVANDFNNDNYIDIAFADFGTNSIGLLFGYENRSYGNLTKYSSGNHSRPISLATGDLNHDNRLDFVVANYGLNNIAVILGSDNNNNNNFILFTFCSTGDSSFPTMLTLIDLNNDYYLDIIVVNSFTSNVGIFFGFGTGYFTTQMIYSSGLTTFVVAVAVADFNNDNILDLAIADSNINNVGILLGLGSGYFGNQTMYSTGPNSNPYAIGVGDFNKDNRIDVAVANSAADNVAILLGHPPMEDDTYNANNTTNNSLQSPPVANDKPVLLGNYYATFRERLSYSTGSSSHPYSIDIGDINNDTYMDIIVANSGNENFGLFFGNGNESFGNEIIYPMDIGSNPQNIILQDFNNDHQLDVAVTDPRIDAIIVLLGNSNGTFSTKMIYSMASGSTPSALITGNLNNDKYLDLVVTNKGTDTISIFFGFDYTSFTQQFPLETGPTSAPTAIAIADFNHDNRLDIVCSLYGTNNVGVFLGYDNGTFTSVMTYGYALSSHPWSVIVGDLNNDDQLDIVVADWGIDNVGILLGYGNGSFTDPFLVSAGIDSRPVVVVVADFNNDKYLDITTANYGGNSVGVFIGYGNGSFHTVITYPTGNGSYPSSITISDTNNDKYLDIIVGNQGINNIGVFLGYGNGSFAEQIISSTGVNSAPLFTSTFDVNRDNILDLVVANYGTSNVGILYGYGNGTFGNMITYSTGINSKPTTINIADLNNDNLPDIVVGDEISNKIGIFFGYSDGTFSSMSIVPLGQGTMIYGLVIGDFNNDNCLDLAFADNGNSKTQVYLQSGSKPFGGQTIFSSGEDSSPSSVAVADINNDYHLDIVTANCGTDNIGIFLGYGNRSFSDMTTYSTTNDSCPSSVTVGDLNNDSQIDIVVANSKSNDIIIFIGFGNGNFSLFMTYLMGDGAEPVSITLGYLNRDSRLDIAIANYGTNNICLLYGSNDGQFTNQTYYPLGYNARPNWIVVKDLNNDQRQDIAVATYGTNNIKILLNIC